MPSQYSNLNFADGEDLSRWREKCAEQREIAKRWPAYDKNMALVEEYQFNIGPWYIVFYLEVWGKHPMWHGGASIREHVGWDTVHVDQGMYKGVHYEIPRDARLATSSWVPEHYQQARYILAETFGPILRSGDKHQPAEEFVGPLSLQWRVPYEGPKFWREKQN